MRFYRSNKHNVGFHSSIGGAEVNFKLATVAKEIIWEKLRAMHDGAAITSCRLFGRG
jgi:hypothetical protein